MRILAINDAAHVCVILERKVWKEGSTIRHYRVNLHSNNKLTHNIHSRLPTYIFVIYVARLLRLRKIFEKGLGKGNFCTNNILFHGRNKKRTIDEENALHVNAKETFSLQKQWSNDWGPSTSNCRMK